MAVGGSGIIFINRKIFIKLYRIHGEGAESGEESKKKRKEKDKEREEQENRILVAKNKIVKYFKHSLNKSNLF